MVTVSDNSLSARDTFFLNKIVGLGVDYTDNIAYVKTTREYLSKKIGVNIRTITRRLNHLGEVGYVNVESKLGKNGGYIIKLNPDKFSFPIDDSLLKNPTKTFTNLVDKLYHKKSRNRGVRRTKTEMDQLRREQERMTSQQRSENKMLETKYLMKPLDWDFFASTSEPDTNFRVWVISRAYDAFVKAYEHKYEVSYRNKEHVGTFYYGKGKKSHSNSYKSLKDGFIGSRNFDAFKKLLDLSRDLNENPIVLMGKVFERYSFNHYSYQHPARIPVPNQVMDKKGVDVIMSSLKNQKEMNRFRMGASTDFLNNAEIIAINREYLSIDNSQDTDYNEELTGDKQLLSLKHYYNQLMFNAKSRLNKSELKVLDYFMREQIDLIIGKTGISHVLSEYATVAFETLKPYIDKSLEEGTINQTFYDLANLMGNYESKATGNATVMLSSAYVANKNGYNIARRVHAIIKQRQGDYYTIHEVMKVIQKVPDLLSLTKSGLLDRKVVLIEYWQIQNLMLKSR